MRGRPKTDYIGRTYGLVTVVRRDGNKLWCTCECGASRYFQPGNLISHPPKIHSKCRHSDQYELMLDSPKNDTYKTI